LMIKIICTQNRPLKARIFNQQSAINNQQYF